MVGSLVRPSARLSVWVTDGLTRTTTVNYDDRPSEGASEYPPPSVSRPRSFSMWVGFTVADRASDPMSCRIVDHLPLRRFARLDISSPSRSTCHFWGGPRTYGAFAAADALTAVPVGEAVPSVGELESASTKAQNNVRVDIIYPSSGRGVLAEPAGLNTLRLRLG